MSITFKKFHASARLSEETVAYDTQVFFEGKKIGSCRNEGRGGEGHLMIERDVDQALVDRAEQWVKQQYYMDDDQIALDHNGLPMQFDRIAEYCDYLAEKTLADKQLKAYTQRTLKKYIVVKPLESPDDLLFYKGPYNDAKRNALISKHPGAHILNDLPIEKSMELFLEEERRQRLRQQAAMSSPARPKGP